MDAGEKVSAFIGKLSFKTTEDSLIRFLKKKGCNPISTRIIIDHDTGKSKGFGYADFSSKSDLDKCLALEGQELDGFNIHCDVAKSAGGGGGARGGGSGGGARGGRSGSFGGNSSGGFQGGRIQQPPGKRLKIGNLSFDSNRDSLEGKFPTAIDVFVVNDKDTGRSRGFGFLEFESIGEATKMMKKWDGKSVDGRDIRLEYAGERPQSGGSGGRGGYQGGRGGGGFQGGRGGGGARRGGRPGFSPNPSRRGAIQAYEGSKKKFADSDDSY